MSGSGCRGCSTDVWHAQGVSHRHLSDHLSDLVESVLSDLENSKVIAIEDDMDLEPLNLGMIAAYYYIAYTTIELLSSSLTAKTKLKGLLEILTSASEFDDLPMRPGNHLISMPVPPCRRTTRPSVASPLSYSTEHEPGVFPTYLMDLIVAEPAVNEASDVSLIHLCLCLAGDEDSVRKLLLHAPLAVEAPKWTDPHTKANSLLQAHFSRTALAGDLAADQRTVVPQATRLLQVCPPPPSSPTSSPGTLR